MKPFISYIGSKGRYTKILKFPDKINNYYEPFIGGGSIFFHINNNYDIKKNFINDLDKDLINVYKCIKNNKVELLRELNKLNKLRTKNNFNNLIEKFNKNKYGNVLKCAIYIYMTKRSYNGNLNYWKNKNIKPNYSNNNSKINIFNKNNIEQISHLLNKKIKINKLDYITFLNKNKPKKGDFVFIDPPYLLLYAKQYYKYVFSLEDFEKLKNECDKLNKNKVNFMLTLNYDIKLKKMFKNYKIKVLKKKNSTVSNGKGCSKGKEKELIITNY